MYFSLAYFSFVIITFMVIVDDTFSQCTAWEGSDSCAGFVDPFDMFNYNRNDKHSTSEKSEESEIETTTTLSDVQKEAVSCECNCENLDNETDFLSDQLYPSQQHSKEKIFLTRFIELLYTTLMLKERALSENDVIHIPLSARVTKRVETILRAFLNREDELHMPTLADLDEVLSDLISLNDHCSPEYSSPSYWELIRVNLYPKDWLVIFVLTSLCCVCIMVYKQYSNSSILTTVFIAALGISWYWEWCNLYQLSLARQQSDLSKHSEMPSSCKPDSLSHWEAVKIWINVNILKGPDPCEKYYEVLLADPIYENTPLKALSNTVATFVFHPLRYAGEGIGAFFDGLLGTLSWYYKIPILAIVVLLIMYLLLLVFNYRIDLPFLLGSARPTYTVNERNTQPAVNNTEEISRPEPTQPTMIQSNSEQRLVVVLKVMTESNRISESVACSEDTGLVLRDSRSSTAICVSSEELLQTVTSENETELTRNLQCTQGIESEGKKQTVEKSEE